MKLLGKTLYLSLALILAGMTSLIYLQSQNFLIKNPNWYAYKSEKGSFSRSPLAGNQLNLNLTLGHPEILNRSLSPLRSLNFYFTIPDHSFIEIILNSHGEKYTSVRLSRSDKITSGTFEGFRSGKLEQFSPLKHVLNGATHHAEIYFFNGILNLSIDNEAVLTESFYTKSSQFGFRSGAIGASVYGIEARDVSEGEIPISLFNHQNFSKIFTKMFLAVFFIPLILVFIIYRKIRLKILVKSMGLMILLSSLWYSYDLYYLSANEKSWSTKEQSIHYKFFKKWGELLGEIKIH